MALELQRGRSKWWYGRVEVNGRKIGKNLGVEVKGVIPASLSEQGGPAFERSRAKAQAALEKLQLDLKRRSTAEELVQTLHEIRTGTRVGSIPLSDAGVRWKALPRRRPLSSRYVSQVESWITDFVTFFAAHYASVREMADVQPSMARAYFAKVEGRGVSGKTYNNTLIFLRSCFEALREEAGIPKNPFVGLPTKEEDTVFRKPYSEEDLAEIVKAAKNDPFIYRFKKVMRAAGFLDLDENATPEEKAQNRGETQQVRAKGLRKASVRDFHSFRVTWVTLALTAGVPIEIVRKVTGHRTAGIVMKHYFQPGREEFRRTLTNKLPSILGGGGPPKALDHEELTIHLKSMKTKTWKQIRDNLLARIAEDSGKLSSSVPAA